MVDKKSTLQILVYVLVISFYAALAANPVLSTETWTQINTDVVKGITVDPSNPSTLYLGVLSPTPGLKKSTDGGSTWSRIGKIGGTGEFGKDIYTKIDPTNPNNLYGWSGVSTSCGFWASTDGGNNWTMPAGFDSVGDLIFTNDMYCVAVDPSDFNHVLLTYHYYWYRGMTGGVVESFDGGKHCILHDPIPGVSGNAGYYVFFLYDPATSQGDGQTWLFMTQEGGTGAGWWRTTNAGTSWTLASSMPMTHGGSNVYYTKSGTIFASGTTAIQKSTDNGVSWVQGNTGLPWTYFMSVIGDGNILYTGNGLTAGGFYTSPESDGITWTKFNSQQFSNGAARLAVAYTNGIVYGSCAQDGLWALKTRSGMTMAGQFKNLSISAHAVIASQTRIFYDIRGRIYSDNKAFHNQPWVVISADGNSPQVGVR
jgi:hypothetical protein